MKGVSIKCRNQAKFVAIFTRITCVSTDTKEPQGTFGGDLQQKGRAVPVCNSILRELEKKVGLHKLWLDRCKKGKTPFVTTKKNITPVGYTPPDSTLLIGNISLA